jgi:hypothetical protein
MKRLCTVEADLKDLISSVQIKYGPQGKYWRLDWHLVVKFGGTKLRAWIRWNDQVNTLSTLSKYSFCYREQPAKDPQPSYLEQYIDNGRVSYTKL